MKKVLLVLLAGYVWFLPATAQRVRTGEKAPEIRVAEWLYSRTPSSAGKAILVDFFHPANESCVTGLKNLENLRSRFGDRIVVIVLTTQSSADARNFFPQEKFQFHVGIDDDGRTFRNFEVRYVPYTVLIDSKGRVVWTGTSREANEDVVKLAF